MNLITELLDDPGVADELRRGRTSLSLRDAIARLGIELTDPGGWAGPPGEEFEPAAPGLLEVAQLARLPASALGEGEDDEPPMDIHHGAPLWLEARYLDPARQEIVVFPNEEDRDHQRVMLYAPGVVLEDSRILDAVSAELQVVDGRRRLLGLFKRHPSCPIGTRQADGTIVCPPVLCPKGGACVPSKLAGPGGAKVRCRCKHDRRP
jgi:hypothetical protein